MNKGHKSLFLLFKICGGINLFIAVLWDSLCPCIYHFFKLSENFIHAHMYFDQVHPLIPYIQFLPAPTFPSHCICLEWLVCVWVWDHPLEHGQPLGVASLKKRDFPSPRSHQFPEAPQLGVGLHLLLPDLQLGILTGLVQVLSGAMSLCMQHWHVQQILLCCRHPFFFQEDPQALKEGLWNDVPFLILCTPTGWKSLTIKRCFSGRVDKCVSLWAQR